MQADRICEELENRRSRGASLDQLLRTAVERLHDAHDRFHWTGIYELYPDNVLRLGPFVGDPTDHVFIAVGNGICGTAIAERRNLHIPDVSKEDNYLACSSQTRSELVVLIRQDKRIFAQIDIDSHDEGPFTDEMVQDVEKVADWLATAYAPAVAVRA
jgi:GAF domain-containing protein